MQTLALIRYSTDYLHITYNICYMSYTDNFHNYFFYSLLIAIVHQTSEHLAAIEIMKLKHILILQNKIDLIKEAQVSNIISSFGTLNQCRKNPRGVLGACLGNF